MDIAKVERAICLLVKKRNYLDKELSFAFDIPGKIAEYPKDYKDKVFGIHNELVLTIRQLTFLSFALKGYKLTGPYNTWKRVNEAFSRSYVGPVTEDERAKAIEAYQAGASMRIKKKERKRERRTKKRRTRHVT